MDVIQWHEDFTESVRQLAGCAFPDGLDEQIRLPLMYVLREHGMSFRSVASFAAVIFANGEGDYTLFLTDAYRTDMDEYRDNPTSEKQIEEQLVNCGFLQWLES